MTEFVAGLVFGLIFAGVVTAGGAYTANRLERQLGLERARTSELLDRLQSRSLEQYHAVQAIPASEPEPEGRWVNDATGLVSAWVPKGED